MVSCSQNQPTSTGQSTELYATTYHWCSEIHPSQELDRETANSDPATWDMIGDENSVEEIRSVINYAGSKF